MALAWKWPWQAQNRSREFITLIIYVSATSIAILSTLLYKSDSGDLQNTWVEDICSEQKAFFDSSANGWFSNTYSLKWLINVFDPSTQPKSPRTWRLLIIDSYSSHINLEFLLAVNERKIYILILPPHSTHRL